MTEANERLLDLRKSFPLGIGVGDSDTATHYGSQPRQRAETVTPSDSTEFDEPSIIYVGVAGNLAVVPFGGTDAVTFTDVPVGWFDRLEVKKVMSTNTTATTMVRVY